jgi:sugar lactone lactonase YvrE
MFLRPLAHAIVLAGLAAACGSSATSDAPGGTTPPGGTPGGPPGSELEAGAPEGGPTYDAGVPTATSVVTIAGKNSATPGFADGDATGGALFNAPEGLALDASDDQLYVADSFNHVIRHVNLVTKKVTTVAGVGTKNGFNDTSTDGGGNFVPAHLDTPRNLLFTTDGASLWFTDTSNFVIRKLDLQAGFKVTTVFGKAGVPGTTDGAYGNARFGKFGQPWAGGMVIDASTNTMYLTDSANQTVRAIDLASGNVTTIAGQAGVAGWADGVGTAAKFNKPNGLALDGKGSLYVVESNNIDIRKIDIATKNVVTVAGKAPNDPTHVCENISPVQPPECGWVDAPNGLDARFRFPFGVALDGAGGMFLVDSHNDVIRRFDMTTTAVATVAGVQKTILDDIPHASEDSAPGQPGTFWHPSHVVMKGPSALIVADRSANCIRLVELGKP